MIAAAKTHKFKYNLKSHIPGLVKQLPNGLLAENIFLMPEGAQVMASIDKNPDVFIEVKKVIKKLL